MKHTTVIAYINHGYRIVFYLIPTTFSIILYLIPGCGTAVFAIIRMFVSLSWRGIIVLQKVEYLVFFLSLTECIDSFAAISSSKPIMDVWVRLTILGRKRRILPRYNIHTTKNKIEELHKYLRIPNVISLHISKKDIHTRK